MNFRVPLRIIDDSPIWVKALAAPVFLLVCFLGVGINAYLTLGRSANDLTMLSQVELPRQRMVSELTHDIMTTQVLLSRYVTWATNGVNPEPLDELGREVIGTLDMLKERLRALRARPDLTPGERGTVTEFLAKWDKYHVGARNTVLVGASDAPMASMLLAGTDDDFKGISIQLLILSAVVSNQTRLVTHDITTAALKHKNILAVGGLLGVLVSVLMTLVVARSIVTPIGAVTDAMKQVAVGRTEGRIGYGDRKDEIGQMVAAIAVFRQSIEQQNQLLKEREAELEAQNLRFDAALANMSQGLSMFDSQQRVIICNDRYGQMYGLSADQVKPGTPLRDIVEHRIAQGIFAFKDPEQYRRERLAPVTTASDKILELSDGRAIAISQRPMSAGGWVTTHEDITDRRRIEARIAHLAHHDALTDLPNRQMFEATLAQAVQKTRRPAAENLDFIFRHGNSREFEGDGGSVIPTGAGSGPFLAGTVRELPRTLDGRGNERPFHDHSENPRAGAHARGPGAADLALSTPAAAVVDRDLHHAKAVAMRLYLHLRGPAERRVFHLEADQGACADRAERAEVGRLRADQQVHERDAQPRARHRVPGMSALLGDPEFA